MLSALDISNFYIKKHVSPLKLQKLLFYSQVWYYVKYKKILFKDDIESWILGPVVYNVWNAFRFIRRGDIINLNKVNPSISLNEEVTCHLDEIWKIYGRFTGLELVDLTHEESLWLDARGDISSNVSSKEKIIINKFTTNYLQLDEDGNIPFPKKNVEGIASFVGNVSEGLF